MTVPGDVALMEVSMGPFFMMLSLVLMLFSVVQVVVELMLMLMLA